MVKYLIANSVKNGNEKRKKGVFLVLSRYLFLLKTLAVIIRRVGFSGRKCNYS